MNVLETRAVAYLLLDIGILYISSFIITWFFAIYLNLNPFELFLIFSCLNFFNSVLQTYLFPFRLIANAYNELGEYKLYGIAVFGLFTGVVNLGLLLHRFDLLTVLFICLGCFLFGPVLYFALSLEKKLIPLLGLNQRTRY